MIWLILLSIVLAVVSAIFYRLSGMGEDGYIRLPFIPEWLFDRQWRRVGCTLITSAMMFISGVHAPWYAHLLAMVLFYGAIVTYWDFMFKNIDNFWVHGFMLGIAAFPFVIWGDVIWWRFLIRAVSLAIFMGVWCDLMKHKWRDDDADEFGRGGILPISAWIL